MLGGTRVWILFFFPRTQLTYFNAVIDCSSANKCLLKVAAYAAQLEQYQKAIEIYEQVRMRACPTGLGQPGCQRLRGAAGVLAVASLGGRAPVPCAGIEAVTAVSAVGM